MLSNWKFYHLKDMESRTSTEQSSTTHGGFQQDADEIELVLKPHPLKESTLTSKRFIKTTSNATSIEIYSFLMCKKLGLLFKNWKLVLEKFYRFSITI